MKYRPSSLQSVIETVRAWQTECDTSKGCGHTRRYLAYQHSLEFLEKVQGGEMTMDQCKDRMRSSIRSCGHHLEKWEAKAAYERLYELVRAMP